MKTNETITFRKNDAVTVPSEHCIFMSNGHASIHFYQSTLSDDYPSIKTWNDLFNIFKPKSFKMYDFNGESKDIVLV